MRTKSTSASTNLAKFASQGYNESSDLIKLSRNSINNSESSEISHKSYLPLLEFIISLILGYSIFFIFTDSLKL